MSVLLPVVGASAVTWWVGLELPRMSLVVSLLVLAPVAVLTGVTMDRVARRVAPLSVLLRMAMVFPDRTPSRFAVAREAGHPRELTRRLLSDDLDESTAAGSVLSLVGALSAHDRRTRGHSERVRAYTDLLSERLGLAEADRDRLRWAGLLHDIGKLDVPREILNKPGRPDATEWQTLQQHPDHGARLAAPLLPWLGAWGEAIAHHHERYDGTGYPRQLAGEEISVGGRIVAVVDSFETMTASRSYKKAMSHRAAREELARCAGSQFDPVVVREFLQISLPRLLWAMGPVAALVQLPFLNSLRYAGGRAVSAGGSAATAFATPAIAAGVVTAIVTPAFASPPAHVRADHVHPMAAVQARTPHPATPAVLPRQPVARRVEADKAVAPSSRAHDHHHTRAVAHHEVRLVDHRTARHPVAKHDAARAVSPLDRPAPAEHPKAESKEPTPERHHDPRDDRHHLRHHGRHHVDHPATPVPHPHPQHGWQRASNHVGRGVFGRHHHHGVWLPWREGRHDHGEAHSGHHHDHGGHESH